jgi:hypothetical protein
MMAFAISRSSTSVVRASSERKPFDFGGEFKKRVSFGKKKFGTLTSKLSDAHKKNLEKLDIIAKDDVEFVKDIIKTGEDEETVFVDFVDSEIVDDSE